LEDDEELLFHMDRLLAADSTLPINGAIRRAAELLKIKDTDALIERVRKKYRRRKMAGTIPVVVPISRQFQKAIEAGFARRERLSLDRAKARKLALARAAVLGLPLTGEADWQIALEQMLHEKSSLDDYGDDSEGVLHRLQNRATTAAKAISLLRDKRAHLLQVEEKISVLRELLASRPI
jgi:hypothetical protein